MGSTEQVTQFRHVPERADVRKRIWLEALAWMERQPRQRPLTRAELLAAATGILGACGVSTASVGYAMVMLSNAFWHAQFLAVPPNRRLLLLPRCLAALPEVHARAQALQYKIHVADGSPVVVRLLAEQEMDAILGVGCLDSLEKAFNKVQQVGVPAIAVPLNAAGCKVTEADNELLRFFLEGHGPAAVARTRNYLPLLRSAHHLFDDATFVPLLKDLAQADDPTAKLGLEWLRRGGKRLRPFATLAGFAAFAPKKEIPDGVKRVALAMEAFHKASLVHDDIEDDDALRYGEPTLHRTHGIPVAINIGDYLLGLGYRLAAEGAGAVDAAAACRLLGLLSRAHVELSLGQGAELAWNGNDAEQTTLEAALKRYMLKTAPAFEVALASGMILAGSYETHAAAIHVFCRHVGAAFQVQNDLAGWEEDAARARPTVLLALAFENADATEREQLLKPGNLERAREICTRHAVLARGRALIGRLRQHALQLVDAQTVRPLQELLRFLVEIIIDADDTEPRIHAEP